MLSPADRGQEIFQMKVRKLYAHILVKSIRISLTPVQTGKIIFDFSLTKPRTQ